MIRQLENFSVTVKVVWRQLGLFKEELIHAPKVIFSTVNPWEKGKTATLMPTLPQFETLYPHKPKQGGLPHE